LLVDFFWWDAQEIGQGALGVKMLGDAQFARRVAEAAEDQHQRHQRPGHRFAARGYRSVEKLFQSQLVDKFQTQPRPAEIFAILNSQTSDIDFRPLRLDVVEESLLTRPLLAFGGFLDAQAMRFVELSEIRDHPLPRAALGAIRFHQRPIGVPFSILPAIARANEHARIVALHQGDPKGKVFTTTPLPASANNST
jgi:hypothetical protein